jgi:hypothetical protein
MFPILVLYSDFPMFFYIVIFQCFQYIDFAHKKKTDTLYEKKRIKNVFFVLSQKKNKKTF